MSEDFESTFPGSKWQFYDYYNGYSWGKRNCRAYAGSYSGWVVGGGSGASLGCLSNYPANAYAPDEISQTWMQYGPFSLTGATAADLSFMLWTNSGNNGSNASDNDRLCALASIDDRDYWGWCWWGYHDWSSASIDLSNVYSLGNLLGREQVWIAFIFDTNLDAISHGEGGYVDNILLRKCMAASCPAGAPSPALADTGDMGPWQAVLPK